MRLFNSFLKLFQSHEIPENHEQCPMCRGMGSTDGLLNCELCGGYGHVSNWDAIKYEQNN